MMNNVLSKGWFSKVSAPISLNGHLCLGYDSSLYRGCYFCLDPWKQSWRRRFYGTAEDAWDPQHGFQFIRQ